MGEGANRIGGKVETDSAMIDGSRSCNGRAVTDVEGGSEILYFLNVIIGREVNDMDGGQGGLRGGSGW